MQVISGKKSCSLIGMGFIFTIIFVISEGFYKLIPQLSHKPEQHITVTTGDTTYIRGQIVRFDLTIQFVNLVVVVSLLNLMYFLK